MTTETIAPALTPVESTWDRLLMCDYCHALETDDVVAAPFFAGLRPMWNDAHGCLVCAMCIENGTWEGDDE